jgi:hypothetical protein
MDLEVEKIKIYKQERKVKVVLSHNQFAEFVPFGKDYITTTSELILKKDIRFIGDKVNQLDYFRRKSERVDPVLYEVKAAENELKQFVGKKVKSIN